jgi:hypothetical protein
MMRRVGKLLGALALLGTVSCVGLCASLRHDLPEAEAGADAEALTDRMLTAVGHGAWLELGAVQWRFRSSGPLFVWDLRGNRFRMEKGTRVVHVDIATREGTVRDGDRLLEGDARTRALEKAWSTFLNDRFWLFPFWQLRAPGTTRSVVELEDGRRALRVDYASGGVTPGDSYVWILDESGRPEAWRLWVSSLPFKGIEVTWAGWTEIDGVLFATEHEAPVLSLPIVDLKAGADLAAIGQADAFD